MISGYFDDTRTNDTIWVVGGYVGYPNQWEVFEDLWNAALTRHDVPYVHMREMGKPMAHSANGIRQRIIKKRF
jgi:hypothetical protein